MKKNNTILKNIKNWIGKNKLEFFLLLTILVVGAFFRLYKISGYMTFLGDEGRDVIIVRRLLTEGHPPLIGPGTSIGNMYLGPIYYYLMAPSLFITHYSPVGPAIQIAFLGVLTILLVWFITREWFGRISAIVASLLYAISPTVIIYSKSSWNPNIMPFFALLTIYSVYKFWVKREFNWILATGVSFAFVLQSHYLGLLLAPTIGIFWLVVLVDLIRKKSKLRLFISRSLIAVFEFLLLMSPLAIFDFRHNFINFNAIKLFFTDRQTTVSVLPWKAIPNTWPIYNDVVTRLPGGREVAAGVILAVLIAIFIVWKLIRFRKMEKSYRNNFLLLLSWLGFGLLGLGLYKQHIYDHYYGFFFAAPFMFAGLIAKELFSFKKKILIGITLIGIVALVYANSIQNPLKYPPNMQMLRAQVVAKKVIEISEGERFNFSLIADANYDSGYRYFLNIYGANIVDIDPQNTKDTITEQLLVICEKEKDKCDPTHNPKAEIAGFGWTKIDQEYDDVFGVTIYKLSHTK